jgi:hypothetical protein
MMLLKENGKERRTLVLRLLDACVRQVTPKAAAVRRCDVYACSAGVQQGGLVVQCNTTFY